MSVWSLGAIVVACSMRHSGGAADPEFRSPEIEMTKPANELRLDAIPSGNDRFDLEQLFAQELSRAPSDYAGLEATLGATPKPQRKTLDVRQARYFDLVTSRLKLTEAQIERLVRKPVQSAWSLAASRPWAESTRRCGRLICQSSVFTDPNTGSVLNSATTGPELMVAAIETRDGPTLFVGPVSGYRQFVGRRTNDQEWQKQIFARQIPSAPAWNTLQSGKGIA